jgi:hypothetical protein
MNARGFAGLLPFLLLLGAAPAAERPTARQVVEAVLTAQETPGFRARARLLYAAPGVERPEVTQLLIKGRRCGEESWTLYQALWPEARRGRTLVLHRRAKGAVEGFLFEPPDRVLPLTRERMTEPLFGSDLTPQDLAEDFWHWPIQEIVGEETLRGRRCVILESHPAKGHGAGISAVKSWVAVDIALPLRLETYAPGGALLKRFEVDRVVKRPGGGWAAASLSVTPASTRSRTVLQGTKSERDIEVPAEDFTPEALSRGFRAE